MPRQIDALTGVRGIAAWFVVVYHIRDSFAHGLPAPVVAVFAKGYLAVDLFFILSGFVLWLTWGAKFARATSATAAEFWRRRIARVWPLHAVVLAATVCFALVVQATGRTVPAHYRWDELPLHFTLMQNWGFTDDLAWNDPSWSISTELAAYLLFPLIAMLIARIKPSPQFAIVLALALFVALDRIFAVNGSHLLGDDIAKLGLARCLTQFFSGVAMCIMWQRWHGTALVVGTIATFGVAILAWTTGNARETLAVPIAFAALVPLLATTSAWSHNPLSCKFAVVLGEISYSTYLAHFLLWTLFKIAVVADPRAVPLSLGGLYLALTLASSFVLYHAVELPARRWLGGAQSKVQRHAAGNPATG